MLDARIQTWAGEPSDSSGFLTHVGMSQREYTAHLHGASMGDLARLRSRGWPKRCGACGGAINYEVGFWLHTPDRVNCVGCPDHPAANAVPWIDA